MWRVTSRIIHFQKTGDLQLPVLFLGLVEMIFPTLLDALPIKRLNSESIISSIINNSQTLVSLIIPQRHGHSFQLAPFTFSWFRISLSRRIWKRPCLQGVLSTLGILTSSLRPLVDVSAFCQISGHLSYLRYVRTLELIFLDFIRRPSVPRWSNLWIFLISIFWYLIK